MGLVLCLAVWAIGLVMVTLPLYSGLLPDGRQPIDGTALRGPTYLVVSVARRSAGAAGRAVADPRAGERGRRVRPVAARAATNLAARVTELEVSRERVVDAAEAERRRIERDLHDGAQQRLVALGR